jgi:hypothetical protein
MVYSVELFSDYVCGYMDLSCELVELIGHFGLCISVVFISRFEMGFGSVCGQ